MLVELSQNDLVNVDGGKAWYEWLGDIGGATCAGAAAFLTVTSGPVGWTIAATAGAAFWVCVN
ncbi:MAG: hypothetical protein IJA10_12215 [Lachnospiraceae bacterium]|nr:hypothetical protein [Lachnospiraceae bacterium]